MVSPKDQSVGCAECHTRNDGRLKNLSGFYMPGRDRIQSIDYIGFAFLLISVVGILGHGFLRLKTQIGNSNKDHGEV
jgi:hypothetical protein